MSFDIMFVIFCSCCLLLYSTGRIFSLKFNFCYAKCYAKLNTFRGEYIYDVKLRVKKQ